MEFANQSLPKLSSLMLYSEMPKILFWGILLQALYLAATIEDEPRVAISNPPELKVIGDNELEVETIFLGCFVSWENTEGLTRQGHAKLVQGEEFNSHACHPLHWNEVRRNIFKFSREYLNCNP